jgi:hypothetical protein
MYTPHETKIREHIQTYPEYWNTTASRYIRRRRRPQARISASLLLEVDSNNNHNNHNNHANKSILDYETKVEEHIQSIGTWLESGKTNGFLGRRRRLQLAMTTTAAKVK